MAGCRDGKPLVQKSWGLKTKGGILVGAGGCPLNLSRLSLERLPTVPSREQSRGFPEHPQSHWHRAVACVLYPTALRDLLMRLPVHELKRLQFLKLREKSWYSPQILQEILAIAANNHIITAKTAEEYAIYP